MEAHDWLTHELQSLHWYAHYLREALTDDALPPSGKNPAAAAGKYLVEWEDTIPDTDPQFGYIDDLFVIFIGLDELMKHGGRHGVTYGDKQLASGQTISDTIREAKKRFRPFWDHMMGDIGSGFQHIARALRRDKTYTDKLIGMLTNYVEAYQQSPRPLEPITEAALDGFMAQYEKGSRRR